MNDTVRLQRLVQEVGRYGCPRCKGSKHYPPGPTGERCEGCEGSGRGRDWCQRVLDGKLVPAER